MNKSPFMITFAGAVGSSKTPIAHHLSVKFGLPIFSNDAMRSEVTEDLGHFDQQEYLRRRDERLEQILTARVSFIYDASIDRAWDEKKEELERHGYTTCILSLDLSKSFMEKLWQAKRYTETLGRIDKLMAEHESFRERHDAEVALHITDATFPQRLGLSSRAVKSCLEK